MNLRVIKWRTVCANLSLAFVSILLTLIVLEFLGRWILNRYPIGYGPDRFVVEHDEYGWLHRPNAEGYWYRYKDGTKHLIAMNSAGFSDQEFHLEKKPGTIRIAFIGDSVTQAWEVAKEDRFIELLRKNDQLKFEFLNFGVRGHGPDQALLILKGTVLAYNPDIVIYSFCVNDFDNILTTKHKPYFDLHNNELILRNVPVKDYQKEWGVFTFRNPFRFFRQRSWVYEMIESRLEFISELEYLYERAIDRFFPKEAETKRDPGQNNEFQWRLFERVLEELRETTNQAGVSFSVLGNATRKSFLADVEDNERIGKLRDIALELDVPFIDVYSEILQRQIESPIDLFHREDSWHYNEVGNELVAEILENWFRKNVVEGTVAIQGAA